jgi:hypothetical protein
MRDVVFLWLQPTIQVICALKEKKEKRKKKMLSLLIKCYTQDELQILEENSTKNSAKLTTPSLVSAPIPNNVPVSYILQDKYS